MKIAIVAPGHVPFEIGGAENLWWGLLNYINQNTHHQADIIKLPAPESNFWELIYSYHYFSQLDLSHFDLIISGKYPAWMVQHPNHICYMLHRLRGLYDTYHFTGYPEIYNSQHPDIISLQKFIKGNQSNRKALDEFFGGIEKLRKRHDLPQDVFQFPGPLIREIIHFLDGVGLSANAIKNFAAISYNLVCRKDYFPNGSKVEVIYPPSNLKSFRRGASDYLFTVSRLDGAKRSNLLVEAMAYVKSNIKLKIAGTGPDESNLRSMAGDDKRILFLGFVKDPELIGLYADALAVLYVPYDEDYGLVTLEAMMSGKPVITTTDSGGPNEFVKNGDTGFSVQPDPKKIAECIDYLCHNQAEAHQMGLKARKSVNGITWGNTVSKLLGMVHNLHKPGP